MSFKLFSVRIKVHFLFTAVVSLLLCIDRGSAAVCSLLAVMLHESGHLAVMLALGQKPQSIYLCASGIHINALCSFGRLKRFALAAGGPAVNLLTAAFTNRPVLKAAMLVCGLFNLLPVSGSDGGDMLECALSGFVPHRAQRGIKIALNVILICACLTGGAVMLTVRANPTLLICAVYFATMTVASSK